MKAWRTYGKFTAMGMLTALVVFSTGLAYGRPNLAEIVREAPSLAQTAADGTGSAYRKAISRDDHSLYIDDKTGRFYLENAVTGRTWWSVPEHVEEDTTVKGKNKVNLQSLVILEYFDPVAGTRDTVGSQSGAVQRGGVAVEAISGGVRIRYDFTGIKIRLALDVTLDSDSFTVTVPTAQIEEYGEYYLSALRLLPSLEAGFQEKGWLFVPDGSGAVAAFDNGRHMMAAYNAPVYGRDINTTLNRQTELVQSAKLPVFGLAKEGRGIFAVITQNAGVASIQAAVSGKDSQFNTVGASFNLRKIDQREMGQSTGQPRTVTLYSTEKLTAVPMQIRYYLLENEQAGLDGMAAVYRAHLQAQGMPKADMSGSLPLYIELLGAVYKKTPVLGVPVMTVQPVTTYAAARRILEEVAKAGAERPVVRYNNWCTDQIKGRVLDEAAAERTLGGKRELTALLEETQATVYLDADFPYVSRWQMGYSKKGYAAKSISQVPTERYVYNVATTFPDERFGKKWLLSPFGMEKIGQSFLSSYRRLGNPYISLGQTSSLLYADFSNPAKTREDSRAALQALHESFRAQEMSLLVSCANEYAAIPAEHILDVPDDSSRYDMLDESVPFYQMVFHGSKYLGSPALNLAADPQTAFLRAVQGGALLHYYFTDPANRSNLEGTEFSGLYSTDSADWLETLTRQYTALLPFYRHTVGQTITHFSYLSPGVSLTRYANGAEAVVNLSSAAYTYRGTAVAAMDYAVWMGQEG